MACEIHFIKLCMSLYIMIPLVSPLLYCYSSPFNAYKWLNLWLLILKKWKITLFFLYFTNTQFLSCVTMCSSILQRRARDYWTTKTFYMDTTLILQDQLKDVHYFKIFTLMNTILLMLLMSFSTLKVMKVIIIGNIRISWYKFR